MTNHSGSDINSTFKPISRISAIIVISIGGIVLFGWAFNIAILQNLITHMPKMMPNTALCFILSGISLLLLQKKSLLLLRGEAEAVSEQNKKILPPHIRTYARGQNDRLKYRIAQICAAIVLLIGIITLNEYILKLLQRHHIGDKITLLFWRALPLKHPCAVPLKPLFNLFRVSKSPFVYSRGEGFNRLANRCLAFLCRVIHVTGYTGNLFFFFRVHSLYVIKFSPFFCTKRLLT